MPPIAPDLSTIQRAVDEYKRCGKNAAAVARSMGVPVSTVRGWIANAERWGVQIDPETAGPIAIEDKERKTDQTNGDQRSIHIVTDATLATPEQVLEYCEIDGSEWEVVKCKITSHKQGQTDADKNPRIVAMVNITLELKRRTPLDPQRAKSEVMDLLARHAPKIPKPSWSRRRNRGELMLEISCPDIHIGKLADAAETGEDYNLKIARSLYLKAHEHILNQACERYDIGQILNVAANDIMHFAGSRYTTTKGTRQDSAGTWQQVYKTARQTAVDGALMCREAAPVRVITHPDNHAHDEAFYIGDALWCYFHNDEHVEVDCGPEPYKFHRHGDCLIGFGHGDKAKYAELQSVMARQRSNDYAECRVKEWHLGHLHKEMMIDSWGDLMFRRLSSLSGTDSWHSAMGYGSRKSAMGFVWSREALEAIIYFTPTDEDYRA